MSQKVTINYEGISMKTIAICEKASHQLCHIDDVIKEVESNASKLIDEDVKRFKAYLLKQKDDIKQSIDKLISEAERRKNRKTQTGSNQQLKDSEKIINEANALNAKVDTFMTEKQYVIKKMINDKLKAYARKQDELLNETDALHISNEMLEKINDIEDIALRETAYTLANNDSNSYTSIESLLTDAKEQLESDTKAIVNDNKENIRNEIKEELHGKKVDKDTIDSIMKSNDINEIRSQASKEIVDETIRKETLKVIIKTIKDRGFVVDKKNIKFRKDKNEVYVLAQKASGEYAEFKIYLDGKFIYKFEGYEGQACQKDIEPFMEDLENIYDINVLKKDVTWSNPDRHQSKKYQHMQSDKIGR